MFHRLGPRRSLSRCASLKLTRRMRRASLTYANTPWRSASASSDSQSRDTRGQRLRSGANQLESDRGQLNTGHLDHKRVAGLRPLHVDRMRNGIALTVKVGDRFRAVPAHLAIRKAASFVTAGIQRLNHRHLSRFDLGNRRKGLVEVCVNADRGQSLHGSVYVRSSGGIFNHA